MKYFNDIVNEKDDSIASALNGTASKVASVLVSGLKKINKKDIKSDFALLKKMNVLQVALNSIQDNF